MLGSGGTWIGSGGGGGVTTLNSLAGAVTLAPGVNVTLTPVGNTITIDASGMAGTISIGSPIVGGSPYKMLYVVPGGNLGQTNTIYDNAGAASINADTRLIYDHLATLSMDYDGRLLQDSSGSATINYGARQLIGPVGGQANLDWANYILKDGAPLNSLDWSTRQLLSSVGSSLALDWANRKLFTTGAVNCLDWDALKLIDGSTIAAIDWSSRYLTDTGGSPVLGWGGSAALGFFTKATAPVSQPNSGITPATYTASGTGSNVTEVDTFDGYTIGQIVAALRVVGLLT